MSIGIISSALWLINRDGQLGNLAAPEHDQGALELNVRDAVELGQARAQASADAGMRAATTQQQNNGFALSEDRPGGSLEQGNHQVQGC